MAEFTRPQLYPKQEAALFSGKRFSFIEASSKSGKTVGAIVWIVEQALKGKPNYNYWWVAPIFGQADIAFRRLKAYLTPGSFSSNEQKMTINLLNGTVIWFKSGDNPDSLYGEDVYGAVIDEASRVKEEAWHAIRSTLSATLGGGLIIGNVKGKNSWYYRLSRKAQEETDNPDSEYHYAKLTIYDAVEGGVIAQSEVKSLQESLPEAVFNELYLAEPSDDYGNPFGESHIRACVQGLSSKPPVVFGIDVARKKDFFVVIGLDEDGKVCFFDRWKGRTWKQSEKITKQIVGDVTPALVDATGIGDRVLEELQDNGFDNFEGFILSPQSKQKLMESLAISIQAHELGFPEGPIVDELCNFVYEVTRTGIKYEAPEGLHDDTVTALALANQKYQEIKASFSKASYASRTAVNKCVVPSREKLEPSALIRYSAFFAVPGSTSDRPSFAIAHLASDGTAILDYIEEFSANQSLTQVIESISKTLNRYAIARIEGDHFAGDWPKEYFSKVGIIYEPTKFTLPEIYRDFMPILAAGEVELLDNPRLLMQLNTLERSVTKVGRDSVNATGNDNLARSVAGLIVTASRGVWATWQKLASRAEMEKNKQQITAQERRAAIAVQKELIAAAKAAQPIRKIQGKEIPGPADEAIFLPLPSVIHFPDATLPRLLTPGRWLVPKGTKALNPHI